MLMSRLRRVVKLFHLRQECREEKHSLLYRDHGHGCVNEEETFFSLSWFRFILVRVL